VAGVQRIVKERYEMRLERSKGTDSEVPYDLQEKLCPFSPDHLGERESCLV